MLRITAIAALMTLSVMAYIPMDSAYAEEPSLDSVLEGFGGDGQGMTPLPPVHDDTPDPIETQHSLSITGDITLGAELGLDNEAPSSPAAKLEPLRALSYSIGLEADYRLPGRGWKAVMDGRATLDAAYTINGAQGYTDELLEDRLYEAEIGEAYVTGPILAWADISVGRMVLNWGQADMLRVVDVVNPLDLRTPGASEIKDLRMPTELGKLDVYMGEYYLSAVVAWEPEPSETPVYGSEFYQLPMPAPQVPDPSGAEFALAVGGRFTGWDGALFAARIYEDRPFMSDGSPSYGRATMFGAGASVARGNLLIKSECAYWDGINTSKGPKDRVDAMLGLEYSGLTDTSIVIEALARRVLGYEAGMQAAPDLMRENQVAWALMYRRDYLNQTLALTVAAQAFGPLGQDGSIGRISLEYDYSDRVRLSVSLINYEPGRTYAFSGNDRLTVGYEYLFGL